MKRIAVLTGAGVSAESGIRTFRDSDGLWENYPVEEVASIEGWGRNPGLMLDFYNERRRQLSECSPNEAHRIIASLEKHYRTDVITQNVDNLHERAGSTHVLHLHGELTKVRPENSYNERDGFSTDKAFGRQGTQRGTAQAAHSMVRGTGTQYRKGNRPCIGGRHTDNSRDFPASISGCRSLQIRRIRCPDLFSRSQTGQPARQKDSHDS